MFCEGETASRTCSPMFCKEENCSRTRTPMLCKGEIASHAADTRWRSDETTVFTQGSGAYKVTPKETS